MKKKQEESKIFYSVVFIDQAIVNSQWYFWKYFSAGFSFIYTKYI